MCPSVEWRSKWQIFQGHNHRFFIVRFAGTTLGMCREKKCDLRHGAVRTEHTLSTRTLMSVSSANIGSKSTKSSKLDTPSKMLYSGSIKGARLDLILLFAIARPLTEDRSVLVVEHLSPIGLALRFLRLAITVSHDLFQNGRCRAQAIRSTE
jgi:hypothetical protein